MTDADLVARRKESPAGAGHYHVTTPYPYRVRASIGGHVVADSSAVMVLKEAGRTLYDPSFYFPPNDVDFDVLERDADHITRCPIKGEASYWHLVAGDDRVERAGWSYDEPLEYSGMIAGHVGFDQRFATLEIFPKSG